jgi:predicted ABC-type ATPase
MAGPNGSGKTTILRAVQNKYFSGPYVNADDIEKSLRLNKVLDLAVSFGLHISCRDFSGFLRKQGTSWKVKADLEKASIGMLCRRGKLISKEMPSAYDAALIADFIRHQFLKAKQTFTFETVLSHPSKIEFIKAAKATGYKNYLYFICTNDPSINVSRVRERVKKGGHSVPLEKIGKRYFESLCKLPSVSNV